MATHAPAMAPHRRRSKERAWPAWLVSALALFSAAFLLRAPSFGDPALFIDEQFYLLVGDRLLHGALPYVDIWDRKPIGLFLIYAAIRLLGGDGIVQYQVVAALFAGAGAVLIARIARRVAPEPAAFVAGLAYIVWIETVEGGGGQSPIFYNPLVAGTALATLAAMAAADTRGALRHGFIAMALGGVAIQIKYTAVFEVGFFGLVLVASLARRLPSRAAAGWTAALAVTALAPTIAAFAFYAAIGEGRAFWFANFASIMLRDANADGKIARRLTTGLAHLLPLALCCATSATVLLRSTSKHRRWGLFVGGWLVAAAAGFASVGAFYYHYLLPLYVPLAVGAAPIIGRLPVGIGFAAIALWVPLANLGWPDFATPAHDRTEISRLRSLLPRDVGSGCLYEYDGPPILFELTRACALSRFVFPDHLTSRVEEHALGIDTSDELRRILAARPAAITVGREADQTRNPRTFAILAAELDRAYRRAGSGVIDERVIDLYTRR